MEALYDASTWILPVLIAVTFHEVAHGYAAWLLGDDTAKNAHRISLNPFRHVDRFGTIVLPGLLYLVHSPVLFGYAKPVPVNFSAVRPERLGAVLVAAAGPGMNVVLAFVSVLLLRFFNHIPWAMTTLHHSIMLNCMLVAFNLLPILPLDGGRIVAALLPASLERPFRKTETYGMVILFALLLVPPYFGFNPLGRVMSWGAQAVAQGVLHAAR